MNRERGSLCPSASHPRVGGPTGDGPAPIVGVEPLGAYSAVSVPPAGVIGAPRLRRWVRRSRWQRPLVVGAALAALVLLTPGTALAHPPPAGRVRPESAAPSTDAAAPAALTVLAQTAVVTPGQAFDLQLRVQTGPLSVSQLGLSVTVYPCLSSVSAFDQSVSSAPSGTPVTSTPSPLPVGGLPTVAGGGVDLAMPVVVGDDDASTASPSGFAIDLIAAAEQCGAYPSGVYPVRVQLENLATRQAVAGVITQLVYAESTAGTERLRVAVVLPVETTLGPSHSPTPAELLSSPGTALDPPSATAASAIGGVVSALEDAPSVPVTLEASPLTLGALDASGHQATVSDLAGLAGNPSVHQFTMTSFAPVNASALVDAGLSNELAEQVSRGSAVLADTVTHPSPSASPIGLGAWITNDGLDPATLTQLAADGYTQMIMPPGDVASPPSDGSAAEPFLVSSTHGPGFTAVVSDPDLTARFPGASEDPVLAAHQLIAELAQIYYEKPNDSTPRAVVAVAPNGWPANPAFVGALTDALDGNPIIDPVTVTGLFGTFDSTAACRSGCRLVPGSSGSDLPAASLRTQRRRINGFASAASGPAARAIAVQLGDLVLAAESEDLRPAQQSGVVANTASAIDAQLGQLQVSGDRTITLTSQQGTLPVTIVSDTRYPVSATLTLTSDKLLFPNGTTQWTQPVTLQLPNNVVDVKVRTRTSGLFKVDVVLHSPQYGLELSSGEVDVRSTATSVVGIVLSLGALSVLVVWWFRTSRKRRALRDADGFEVTGEPPESP